MKRIKFICTVFVFLFLAIFTNCSKEKQEIKDNIWEVESMKAHADSALRYYKEEEEISRRVPILYFERNKYFFQNRIVDDHGKVKFKKNNGIEFEESFLTLLIGGGTEFGYDCLNLLIKNINYYTINNNKLVLTGDNGATINLIKQE